MSTQTAHILRAPPVSTTLEHAVSGGQKKEAEEKTVTFAQYLEIMKTAAGLQARDALQTHYLEQREQTSRINSELPDITDTISLSEIYVNAADKDVQIQRRYIDDAIAIVCPTRLQRMEQLRKIGLEAPEKYWVEENTKQYICHLENVLQQEYPLLDLTIACKSSANGYSHRVTLTETKIEERTGLLATTGKALKKTSVPLLQTLGEKMRTKQSLYIWGTMYIGERLSFVYANDLRFATLCKKIPVPAGVNQHINMTEVGYKSVLG